MRFRFSIAHVPGKDLAIADTLSRAPASGPAAADELFQQEANAFVNIVLQHLPASEQRLEEIKKRQGEDEDYQQLTLFCQSGWPDKHRLTATMKPYFSVAAELSVENGLLLRGNRIVIPPLRKELLGRIHDGHQGITKCRVRTPWWESKFLFCLALIA